MRQAISMERGYQRNFSEMPAGRYKVKGRARKARTMVKVLSDHFDSPLAGLRLLNVGGSSGIIDNYLADAFGEVTSIDIDEGAIEKAQASFQRDNLRYQVGDAMQLDFSDATFDVVICSQVYEHVPDAHRMMDEILRVLVPGGLCYFAASNRLMWNEPHYDLPLLSVMPRALAHRYIKWARKADHYHELHYSYWGLKHLVRKFRVHDYTAKMMRDPERFGVDYMVKPGSAKAGIGVFITQYLFWASPRYIWLLEKPSLDD